VHVTGLAANERFIRFDFAGEFVDGAHRESVPDAVIHEPGRLLAHADHAVDFIRTDTVLVVHDLPHRGKPLVQAQRRVLEDGTGLDGELTACVACATLPAVVLRHKRDVLATAARALDTVRPAARNDPLPAVDRIGEKHDCLLESGGFHYPSLPTCTVICQVSYCPG